MSEKRRNIYTRNPDLFDAFQMAVKKNVIKARSASDRLDTLVERDMRKVTAACAKAGIKLPKSFLASLPRRKSHPRITVNP